MPLLFAQRMLLRSRGSLWPVLSIPPPLGAVLPLMVTLVSAGSLWSLAIPPPLIWAALPLISTLVSTGKLT